MNTYCEEQRSIQQQLRQQIEVYDQAIQLVEQLAVQYDLSQSRQTRLEELNRLMTEASQQTETFKNRNPGFMQRLEQSGELRGLARDLARKVGILMTLFEKIENRATEMRQIMSPRANERLRLSRMKSAYTAS